MKFIKRVGLLSMMSLFPLFAMANGGVTISGQVESYRVCSYPFQGVQLVAFVYKVNDVWLHTILSHEAEALHVVGTAKNQRDIVMLAKSTNKEIEAYYLPNGPITMCGIVTTGQASHPGDWYVAMK